MWMETCLNSQVRGISQVAYPGHSLAAGPLSGIDSTRCWKHSSDIVVNIDMIASRNCCRFFGCTSMMQISCSTTFQRCCIGFRSGDCGGHWSTVNSMSCSRNQSEIISALDMACYPAESNHQKMSTLWSPKGWSGRLWHLNDARLVLRGPQCGKKISLTPLHHHQPETFIQGRMDPYLYVVYAKFWPYHLNVSAEIQTHQTRQCFCFFFVQFWWARVNYSLSFLFLADRSGSQCVVIIWVTVAFLSSWNGLAILVWPLASTRHFCPENCCSLDIFSFRTILCEH